MKLIAALTFLPLFAVTSQATLLWTVGLDDNAQPTDGSGGGAATNFIQEKDGATPLPGNPANTGGAGNTRDIDDDYYFAGVYTTALDGGGVVLGATVALNEENAERAFAGADNHLRYHFNLPTDILGETELKVTWDAMALDQREVEAPNPRYGVETYFNGFKIADEVLITPSMFDVKQTATVTLDSVGGMAGEGFDNYVELRGINYNADGGGNWMSVDYIQLEQVPEPSTGLLVFFGSLALLPVFRRRRS